MHPYIFLLLLSSGVSSNFLSQKKMPHLNETKYVLIDEMLCLLEAENEHIEEKFFTPLHIKDRKCAHTNSEIFIQELKKIDKRKCIKNVEKGMEKLEKICDLLKKSPSNDKNCSDTVKTNFSKFKESLQEFLRWVNEKVNCISIARSELCLYLDGKCSCHDSWKSHRGLG